MPQIKRVGTSGWSYPEWTGALYPKGTRAGDYLSVYARHFNTVEINNTFYRMPQEKMLRRWTDITPDDFKFSIKMWRAIVHAGVPDADHIKTFYKAIDILEEKVGPILFQLPPKRDADIEWLDTLLKAQPKGYDYVFELRDKRWLTDGVYDCLRKHNAANCQYDFKGFVNPEVATSDLLYIRLHGPHKQPYKGRYAPERLKHYALLMRNHKGKAYCYFDNTMDGAAVEDARLLAPAAA